MRISTRKSLWSSAVAGASCVALIASAASAQVLDVDLRSSAFYEPSKSSKLLVINPALSVAATPVDWLKIQANYEADIVSGASEPVKAGRLGGVDVVSAATDFHDTRHQFGGGLTLTRESTELAASYSYGTESDYHSQAITVSGATNFLQKNTELRLSYARGFDKVCTSSFAEADAPSSRPTLDSSKGCFTKAEGRDVRKVDLDSFQAGWTQTWTPVLATQFVLTGALQHGFLGNPYRGVVIAPAGDVALENHPENRARAAAALRARLYVRAIRTAFGVGVNLYRDTWDLLGQTFEVDGERYLLPGLRVQIRARYYTQTGALFYSDDYTGGEPVDGPRGQYWTGDRELSPLNSVLLGGRFVYSKRATPEQRILGAFLGISGNVGLDLMKTHLKSFTWGGVTPDDTFAALLHLGLSGEF
ncbi:MAG TPA: DUF3570 domain-containing protein [Polyangiaceae bacterium]|nr:DUF3570 domain-containing protein [Polyangiaceae bacterium]